MRGFVNAFIYQMAFDQVYWLEHGLYEVREEIFMINIEKGFSILSHLIEQ